MTVGIILAGAVFVLAFFVGIYLPVLEFGDKRLRYRSRATCRIGLHRWMLPDGKRTNAVNVDRVCFHCGKVDLGAQRQREQIERLSNARGQSRSEEK